MNSSETLGLGKPSIQKCSKHFKTVAQHINTSGKRTFPATLTALPPCQEQPIQSNTIQNVGNSADANKRRLQNTPTHGPYSHRHV